MQSPPSKDGKRDSTNYNLPQRQHYDNRPSREINEQAFHNIYAENRPYFNPEFNSSPFHNSTNDDNSSYEYDSRPVFNYQNPDFGHRRKNYMTDNPLPGTSVDFSDTSHNEIPTVGSAGRSNSIEMKVFSNLNYVNDDYEDELMQIVFPDQSELVHRHHRTTSIHRNATFKTVPDASTRTIPRSLEERRHWMGPAGKKQRRSIIKIEDHANNIASRMEQDGALMENNHESSLLRREALRDMPQCLTVKRIIKRKLKSSVSMHSKHKPIGCTQRLKYYLSMKFTKMQDSLKSVGYSFELWYSSLKQIEGHFGSGVATYFKFLRWLFKINLFITFCAMGFVILPQLLHIYIRPIYKENNTKNNSMVVSTDNVLFKVQNIFDGEGYLTNTILYYGFYTTEDIILVPNFMYHMPYAYFLTMACLYGISFCILSTSMAKSYRRSFIETQGGLKNIYAHKIFCGWDYSIATEEAANLKSSSIYHELKEIISDVENPQSRSGFCKAAWTIIVQILINTFIIILLVCIGYVMWFLLEKHSIRENTKETSSNIAIITAVLINLIMILFPIIFGAVIRYEDYKHPRAALYITLVRTFLLKSVVVGVFLAFWLTHSNTEECWETSIGQHIYRLLLFDFLFSFILGTVVHITRYIIYKKWTKKVGLPEFNIAQHTLELLYNQTLFWVGFYFCPLLSVIILLKLWITWYMRRAYVLCICKPFSKSWRAAQTQTLFLILSFLSLLLVIIAHGYIIVGVKTSNCGPLREYPYMYEMILRDMFKLEQDNKFWKVLLYLRKPGTVALIFIAMGVGVYYLRARGKAQEGMVKILREMLLLEAKDKEFLLECISKVMDERWQRNLDKGVPEVWNRFENDAQFTVEVKKPKNKEHFGDSGHSSGSSVALLKP